MGYSFRLAARVLLYAPSHRQDNTYHSICYTSPEALAGTRPDNEGNVPNAKPLQWRIYTKNKGGGWIGMESIGLGNLHPKCHYECQEMMGEGGG